VYYYAGIVFGHHLVLQIRTLARDIDMSKC